MFSILKIDEISYFLISPLLSPMIRVQASGRRAEEEAGNSKLITLSCGIIMSITILVAKINESFLIKGYFV